METISELVFHEIFDLSYHPSEMALNHLLEQIEERGYIIRRTNNYDHAIIVEFYYPSDHQIIGELRIDRIRRLFDIVIKIDKEVVLPVSGDWSSVLQYLQKATPNIDYIQ